MTAIIILSPIVLAAGVILWLLWKRHQETHSRREAPRIFRDDDDDGF